MKRLPTDASVALVALILESTATLARRAGLGLDDLVELLENACFLEYRQRDLSVPQIAKRLRKSERTIASIKKRAETDDLLEASASLRVRRTVLLQLLSGPQHDRVLRAHFGKREQTTVTQELGYLIETAAITHTNDSEVYALTTEYVPLQREELAARLDAVRHYLNATTDLLTQRFAVGKLTSFAFARVFTFPARQGALESLARHAAAQLQELATATDAEAPEEDAAHTTITLAIIKAISKVKR